MRGKRRRSASTIAAASSTESVVCVTYARLAGSAIDESLDVGDGFDEMDAAFTLAHRPLDLRMSGVADHHDRPAVVAHAGYFNMDLGDERAGSVEYSKAPRLGVGAHCLRDTVRRKHDRAAGGDFVQLLDEYRAFRLQIIDHELVVDDLVADVDRRAELRKRLFDDGDRAVDTGAKTAWIGEHDVHQLPRPDGSGAIVRAAVHEAVDDQQRRARR